MSKTPSSADSAPINGADERELFAAYIGMEDPSDAKEWKDPQVAEPFKHWLAGYRASLGAAQVPAPIPSEGAWRSCTGCHETNEGRDTGRFSTVLKCTVGNGCEECGWVGAIWDATDYSAMTESAGAAQVPVLWVSPKQAAKLTDPDDLEAGRYLPCRRTPAGLFTQPLYAHPSAGAAQVPSLKTVAKLLAAAAYHLKEHSSDYDYVSPQSLQKQLKEAAAALSQQGDAKPSQQGQGS